MFKFIPWSLAVLSLAVPVPALAVGDAFDGAQPTPSRTTTRKNGECYNTQNGSKVCWFRVQGETYSVAVHNPRIDESPQSFLITCGGKWRAYGGFPKDHSQAFVDAFCDDV